MPKTTRKYIIGAHVETYVELPFRVEAETIEEVEEFAARNWNLMETIGEPFITYEIISEEQLQFDFFKDYDDSLASEDHTDE
jgi:hypothetical protein